MIIPSQQGRYALTGKNCSKTANSGIFQRTNIAECNKESQVSFSTLANPLRRRFARQLERLVKMQFFEPSHFFLFSVRRISRLRLISIKQIISMSFVVHL
jgi:hypothetical protein